VTRRLREDPDTLAEYLEALAGHTGLPYVQLEKDFWLTEALRGVSAASAHEGVPIYFKGGTSLSKIFGIIERFSEDVDVLVALPTTDAVMNANQRDRALRRLCQGAEQATGLSGVTNPTKTRKGDKRAVHLPYRGADADGLSLAPLRPEGVLVELGRWGGSEPHTQRSVTSVLAQHATALGLDPFEEQQDFVVNVVDPVRTAVEKLVLLENAAADPNERRRRTVARHYYDVWCLLRHEATREQLLRPDQVAAIAREVFVYTHYFKHDNHKASVRERPLAGFSSSSAFDATNDALAVVLDVYESTVLDGLLWPTAARRPSFEECCTTVTSFGGGL
jgi:predicted nucleotidyltransferase component of viral defense system